MSERTCTIEGCGRRHKARGWCAFHYHRYLTRNGDVSDPIPLTFEQRLWSKVNKSGPVPNFRPALGSCWIWTASLDPNGYGQFAVDATKASNSVRRAHRVVYEVVVGPVSEDLDLDHLCRVRACVNPSHLEPVSRRVNILRGFTLPARQVMFTHCPQGHPYDEQNTYWYGNNRKCRKCRYQAGVRAAAKRRLAVQSPTTPEGS